MVGTTLVRFGHDGWLAQLARDVTFDSIESVARAAGFIMVRDYPEHARLVVAYDRRFLSDRFAQGIARDLASIGIEICLISRPVPLPLLSFAIGHFDAVGGIMVTGGNEPSHISGIKLRGRDGGALPGWMLRQIEERLESPPSLRRIRPTARVTILDPTDDYLASVANQLPLRAVRESGITVAIDSLWGAASEFVPTLTDGDGSRSIEIRTTHNPMFPELERPAPGFENLERLRRIVRTGDAALGLAIGADGTTLGLMDENGAPISPGMTMAILSWYLLFLRKRTGTIARTISSSGLVDAIAAEARVLVHEMPCGFTATCETMREQHPMLLGDEEGGFILADHLLERDAVMAATLVVSCLVGADMELSQLADEIRQIGGYRSLENARVQLISGQSDVVRERIIQDDWPSEIDGLRVNEWYLSDGIKFMLDDEAWLLMRIDQVDGDLHLVAEAPSSDQASKLILAGRRLLKV